MSIKECVEKYKNANKELCDTVRAELENEVKNILAEDDITYYFLGYTPSFNDGDPCTFTTYLQEELYDDEGEYIGDAPSYEKLDILFGSIPNEILSQIYNDWGFRLVLTKNGIEVEDYDCGY